MISPSNDFYAIIQAFGFANCIINFYKILNIGLSAS